MNRRSMLRLVGVGAAGALAGCLDEPLSRTGDSPDGSELEGPHRFVIEAETEDPSHHLPLELSYDLDDASITPDDPARMSWTVRNTGEGPLTLESGPPWPFDVAFLLREDVEDGERVTMWTDAYEESDHLHTDGRDVSSWDPGFVTDRLGSGGSFTETYELAHDAPRLAAGTYEFWRIVRRNATRRTTSRSSSSRWRSNPSEPTVTDPVGSAVGSSKRSRASVFRRSFIGQNVVRHVAWP